MRTLHPAIKNAVMSVMSATKKRIVQTLESEVYVEPTLEELLSNFASGRVASDSIEQAFWHLRAQNEELKELVRALTMENELLRGQNE